MSGAFGQGKSRNLFQNLQGILTRMRLEMHGGKARTAIFRPPPAPPTCSGTSFLNPVSPQVTCCEQREVLCRYPLGPQEGYFLERRLETFSVTGWRVNI